MQKLLKSLSKDDLGKAQRMIEEKRTELLRDSDSEEETGVKKRDQKRLQKEGHSGVMKSADYFRSKKLDYVESSDEKENYKYCTRVVSLDTEEEPKVQKLNYASILNKLKKILGPQQSINRNSNQIAK